MTDTVKKRGGKPATDKAVNHARGMRTLTVAGVTYRVCVTMESLSIIEDAFGIENLRELEEALGRSGSRQLAMLLAALVNAGEDREAVTVEECRRWKITIPEVFAALWGALSAAGAQTDEEAASSGN